MPFFFKKGNCYSHLYFLGITLLSKKRWHLEGHLNPFVLGKSLSKFKNHEISIISSTKMGNISCALVFKITYPFLRFCSVSLIFPYLPSGKLFLFQFPVIFSHLGH